MRPDEASFRARLYCKQDTYRQPPGDVLKIALVSLLKSQSYLGSSEMSFIPGWRQKNVAGVSRELVQPLLKATLLMPFPWWLTKLAALETVSVYLYILSPPLLTARPVCPADLGKECPVSSPASVERDHRCMGRRCCRGTVLLPPMRLWPRATTC